MGARRIGVASLAPLGCLPGAITIFGFGNNNYCVDRLNYDAIEVELERKRNEIIKSGNKPQPPNDPAHRSSDEDNPIPPQLRRPHLQPIAPPTVTASAKPWRSATSQDFKNHTPTGRFCNGKLAIDFLVDTLGFDSYPLPYQNTKATDRNLIKGANFASGHNFIDKAIGKLWRGPKENNRNGFKEAKKGCCGTGLVETSVLCNKLQLFGTCSNSSEYVFWDSFHPSEAANSILANDMVSVGSSLVF
uniref:GDSL esterase/lipase n=1 Tax=Cannabis sativa TaxID=3483 RepID=A0A803QMM9_CANSA